MARGKHLSHFCAHCDKVTKMEKIGSVENQPEKTWYRCTRCRHASLLDLEAMKRSQEEAAKKIDKSSAAVYSPENTYQVGDAIFHTEWDDIGKIVSKELTSGGDKAIVVSFEKLGEKRLLEGIAEN